jgi:hypothetical protein
MDTSIDYHFTSAQTLNPQSIAAEKLSPQESSFFTILNPKCESLVQTKEAQSQIQSRNQYFLGRKGKIGWNLKWGA